MAPSRSAPRLLGLAARSAAPALACAVLLAGAGGPESPQAATSPAGRPAAAERDVPILLYHHISAPPAGTRNPALWVPRTRFRQQIAALARAGYHGVTLGQVWRHWHAGAALPPKPIVVSFDDGYVSQHRNALPVLRRHGWPAVLNLQWSRLGASGGLSRAEVRRLIGAGWEIGDHTITHPDLTEAGAAALRREVAASRTTMARELGVAVDFFCYPYGHVDVRVERAVRGAGFLAATTTVRRRASATGDPFRLGRIIASGRTTPAALVRLVGRTR